MQILFGVKYIAHGVLLSPALDRFVSAGLRIIELANNFRTKEILRISKALSSADQPQYVFQLDQINFVALLYHGIHTRALSWKH
jgi:hypothetical protein